MKFYYFQGHDTTAMALCFAVSLLAEHKEIQVEKRNQNTKKFLKILLIKK